jgi:hypothetical protein
MDPEDLLAEVLPEPEDEAAADEAADEATEPKADAAPKQPAAPPERIHLAPRDVRPAQATAAKSPPAEMPSPSRNGGSAKPHADREEYVSLAAVKPSAAREECAVPRRTSCLEQFVTRIPKQELQTAGT